MMFGERGTEESMDADILCTIVFEGWLVPTLDGKGFETTRHLDAGDPFKTWKDPSQERALRFTIDSKVQPMFEGVIQSCFDCGADHVHAVVVDWDDGLPADVRVRSAYDDLVFYTYIDRDGAYSSLP